MICFSEKELEKKVCRALGFSVKIALVQNEDLKANFLLEKEKQRLKKMKSPKRKMEWLLGRKALKKVLHVLKKDCDTSALSFPNPFCSLTHSQNTAIAIGVSRKKIKGIGIDLEFNRFLSIKTARFFLAPQEKIWVEKVRENENHLLRLWCIKEAIYKSDPQNKKRRLSSYELENPSQEKGRAFLRKRSTAYFYYVAIALPKGWLALAYAL
jgi:4'-phosphopantetheinyl transferase EntD